MEKTYNVDLVRDEILLLDGKCRVKVQEVIDKVKAQQKFGFDSDLINSLLLKAEECGEFFYRSITLDYCRYCKTSVTYAPFKSGPRKGKDNPKKPRRPRGIQINPGFITIRNHGDFCSECDEKHQITATIEKTILEKGLKIQTMKDTIYVKDPMKVCGECGKDIYESEMGVEQTIMGDGHYAAECPYCHFKSIGFGKSHESGKGQFRMIRKEEKRKFYFRKCACGEWFKNIFGEKPWDYKCSKCREEP
jgi:hypothetical protein